MKPLSFLIFFLLVFVSPQAVAWDQFKANDNSQGLEKVSLQLQWKHQFEYAGFYAQEGLDVDFYEIESGKNILHVIRRRSH